MTFILALDQGTTSSRAVVFDHDGAVRGLAQKEFGQIYPRPGWVEHDPDDIWSSQIGVAHEALARAGAAPGDIAAIGITNQRETTVVWDRATGRPIANAIVWQDRRTADLCERLRRDGHEPTFAARTGLKLDPYFSGTKIAWILEHVPDARRLADLGRLAFGTVDSWLVWQLSGGAAHVTDATNASRTLLYDIRADRWDDELLGILGVPRSMLPRVCASSGIAAATDPRVFGARVPVAGIAGDQHAALFGQCCFAPGMVKNTYGTGCFMLLHTGAAPLHAPGGLLATTAWRIGERSEYALEGSVFIAGAVVQWLRDGLGIIRSSADVEALATRVPDNGGVFLVPAFTGLGAPHWDPHARGTICGLTRGATAAHIARAAIESIAFQSAEVLASMQSAGVPVTELRVDGGAARNDLLMQFQADLLGVRVARPVQTESTALGTAYLAGLAVGYWRDRDELAAQWRLDRSFEPAMDRARAAQMLGEWRRAVERSRDWARD